MDLSEIKHRVKTWKELGTQSRFPIHVSVLENLIREVEAYRSIPKYIIDAARGAKHEEPITKSR